MPSVFELLFDTYGDHLMQEQAPYDEAEIQAALDRMSMPQDMQIQVCDLLSSRYLRWGTAALRHRPAAGPHPWAASPRTGKSLRKLPQDDDPRGDGQPQHQGQIVPPLRTAAHGAWCVPRRRGSSGTPWPPPARPPGGRR